MSNKELTLGQKLIKSIEAKKDLIIKSFSSKTGVEKLLQDAEEQAAIFLDSYDLSTPKGRDDLKSKAYLFTTLKTTLDGYAKESTKEERKTIAAVNANTKIMRDKLVDIKNRVRQPLTDWENEEKKYQAEIDGLIKKASKLLTSNPQKKGEIELALSEVEGIASSADSERLSDHCEMVTKFLNENLASALAEIESEKKRKQLQADKLEADRLLKEANDQAAAAQKVIDDQAKAAQEMADKLKEMEAKEAARIAKEKADAEERQLKEEARIAKEKADKIQAKADQLAAKQKAKADKEASDKAAQDALDKAVQDALDKQLADIEKSKELKKLAIEAEKQAIQDAKDAQKKEAADKLEAEKAADAKKAADLADKKAKHEAKKKAQVVEEARRLSVIDSIKADLVSEGISDKVAAKLIVKIIDGEVPNLEINFN